MKIEITIKWNNFIKILDKFYDALKIDKDDDIKELIKRGIGYHVIIIINFKFQFKIIFTRIQ